MFEKMIGTEVTTNEHQSTDVSKSDGVIGNPPVNIENTVPEGSDVVETSSQSKLEIFKYYTWFLIRLMGLGRDFYIFVLQPLSNNQN